MNKGGKRKFYLWKSNIAALWHPSSYLLLLYDSDFQNINFSWTFLHFVILPKKWKYDEHDK